VGDLQGSSTKCAGAANQCLKPESKDFRGGSPRAHFEHAATVLVGQPPAEFMLRPLPLTTRPTGDPLMCAVGVA